MCTFSLPFKVWCSNMLIFCRDPNMTRCHSGLYLCGLNGRRAQHSTDFVLRFSNTCCLNKLVFIFLYSYCVSMTLLNKTLKCREGAGIIRWNSGNIFLCFKQNWSKNTDAIKKWSSQQGFQPHQHYFMLHKCIQNKNIMNSKLQKQIEIENGIFTGSY